MHILQIVNHTFAIENSKMDSIKKIQLRPKMFTVLFYNDQCEKDKNRVVALNPELAGETTCYRYCRVVLVLFFRSKSHYKFAFQNVGACE